MKQNITILLPYSSQIYCTRSDWLNNYNSVLLTINFSFIVLDCITGP